MSTNTEIRPPLPPFTRESAVEKVRLAEDGWNTRDAAKVSLAYSLDTRWRNRAEFANGRNEARGFLERKWSKEHEYRLMRVAASGRSDCRWAPQSARGPENRQSWTSAGLSCQSSPK